MVDVGRCRGIHWIPREAAEVRANMGPTSGSNLRVRRVDVWRAIVQELWVHSLLRDCVIM